MLDHFLAAASLVLQWQNFLFMGLGVMLGTTVGAIPGLTGVMAIAIFLPMTYYFPPLVSIIFLISISKGALYGGSIPAILIRIPGTPAASATVIDGYELAKQGKSEKALKMALYAAVIGDLASDLVLVVVAAPLATVALMFGPAEYTVLIIFSLTIVASVAGKSIIKGLIAAGFGLMLSTVGLDPIMSTRRLTFGILELDSGIDMIPMMIGLFALTEVFRSVVREKLTKEKGKYFLAKPKSRDDTIVTKSEMKRCLIPIFRSSAIGTFLGATPGIGNTVAAFAGYASTFQTSKHPEKFGKGALEGVAAPEAASNAVSGANMIPLLTLGIPGDLTAALLLGAFMIHGLSPGPLLFKENITLIYALFICMGIANFFVLAIGRIFIYLSSNLLKIRKTVIIPAIVAFCIVGSYAINNSLFDVKMMFLFGLLGYVMEKFEFPTPPLIIAFILGEILERSVGQAIIISRGSLAIFFTKPIPIILWVLTVLALLGIILQRLRRKS